MASFFKPFQVVLSVGSALVAVCYFCRLFSYASAFMLDGHAQLCGNSEWAWSLYSNCFHSGFLWLALLHWPLSVKHGENIGVVGRTGAGKSTLSLALLRFVEASSGCILLDGVGISKIGLEELRRSVTIVPQDPVLLNDTICFNLDPLNEHPDVIVWDALRSTHLMRENSSQNTSRASSINEGANSTDGDTPLLERMGDIFSSLDAGIKENGQNLSLGQWQLVALARAFVRRSRLLIMDEATATVDFDTDDRIQRTIRGYEFANSTLLCIAHRLCTIIDYDRVLVLDNRKVVEFDMPYCLLQNKGRVFRSMYEKAGSTSI